MTTQNKLKELIQGMTAEQKAVNLKTLQYIKTIANSSNTDISSWDILKIFAAQDGLNLVSEKNAINRLFFEYLPKAKEELKKTAAEEEAQSAELNTAELLAVFKTAAAKARLQLADQKALQVANAKRDVDNTWNTYADYQKKFFKASEELRVFKTGEDDLTQYNKVIDGIKKVISDGLFINPVFKDGYLYLNTKSNIVLREANKQANLDLHLDLGQLSVRIDTNEQFKFAVIPYRNNLDAGNGYPGYFHPHVQSADGRICWGDAATLSNQQIANLELDKSLRLLHTLLNSYNSGSPYITLANLKLQGKKMNYSLLGGNMKHPDLLKPAKTKQVSDPAFTAVEPTNQGGFANVYVPPTQDIQF